MRLAGRLTVRALSPLVLTAVALVVGGCVAGDTEQPTSAPSPDSSGVATGGSGDPVTETALPCLDPAEAMALGSPYVEQDPALFTTAGGPVYVTVRRFPSGGVFDPDRWRAGLYVGPESTPPTYDVRSGAVPEALVSTSVVEDTWTSLELPAGRYWLWTTNGGDVAVATCSPGVLSEPAPVTPTPAALRN